MALDDPSRESYIDRSYDFAVCGLGMAGMSVAAHLSQALPETSTAILLDPRREFHRDKSWCFWQTDRSLLDSAVSHRWTRWCVRWGGREVVHESIDNPYVHVDSGRYYAASLELAERHPGFDVALGSAVNNIRQQGDLMHFSAGERAFRAKYFFDSRPRSTQDGTLLQHFHGWEVECENAAFDPCKVTLMDFQASQNGDIHFMYVLPFSHHRALIETTHFSQQVMQREQYKTEIRRYMERLGCGDFKIDRTETGVIPMRIEPSRDVNVESRLVAIGVTSETTKASSGYCYGATQKQAKRIAQHVLPPYPDQWRSDRSSIARWFDGVFVRYLTQHPDKAPDAFFSLFDQNDTETLIRFLTDCANPSDYLSVVRSLPKLSMSKQALAHALGA